MRRISSLSEPILKDLVRPEKESDLAGGGVGAVGTVHRVLLHIVSPILANGSRRRLGRIGGAHDFAILQDRVIPFQDRNEYRARRHIGAQTLKKRPLFV